MAQAGICVDDESVVWPVARALGSVNEQTARLVDDAEDQRRDEVIRRRITNKEIRDAMRPSFR